MSELISSYSQARKFSTVQMHHSHDETKISLYIMFLCTHVHVIYIYVKYTIDYLLDYAFLIANVVF